MHATQAAVLATLRQVRKFLDDRKEELSGIDLAGAGTNLDDVIAQFTAQSIDQNAGTTHRISETARIAMLRRALRVGQMKPIAVVARATLRESPELKPFLLPGAATSSTQLIATAASVAEQAKNHEQVFIEGGLPRDFIAQLNAAATALMECLASRGEGQTRAIGATTAIAPLTQRGRSVLRVLDALITPKLFLNDRLLGEWKTVRTVPKKPGPARSTSAHGARTPVALVVPPMQAGSPPLAPITDPTATAA